MFNPPKVAEWQWLDESCGLWFPWYTLPCLEEISKWDLKDKIVWEFGGGNSTLWWAKKCKHVYTVESNWQWWDYVYKKSEELGIHNLDCELREINEGDQVRKEEYTRALFKYPNPDIVIVDGILRNECLEVGIEVLGNKGGHIIADNFMQSFVWISPAAVELMKPYDTKYFKQEDHQDHDGSPWQTATFTIPKRE